MMRDKHGLCITIASEEIAGEYDRSRDLVFLRVYDYDNDLLLVESENNDNVLPCTPSFVTLCYKRLWGSEPRERPVLRTRGCLPSKQWRVLDSTRRLGPILEMLLLR